MHATGILCARGELQRGTPHLSTGTHAPPLLGVVGALVGPGLGHQGKDALAITVSFGAVGVASAANVGPVYRRTHGNRKVLPS